MALAAVVVLLSVYAVLNRGLSDYRQSRAARRLPLLQRAVQAWMAGQLSITEVLQILGQDHKSALGALLGMASIGSRQDQANLHPLFVQLGFQDAALRALKHRNHGARARAAVHLGYMGGQTAAPALIDALQDEQLDVRLAAAQALVQLQHASAVIPILDALALPGRWAGQRATELLQAMGTPVIGPLRWLLKPAAIPRSAETMAVVLNVLGLLKAREAVDEVAPLLAHADSEVRVAAAKALGNLGDTRIAASLLIALRDPAWEVRSMAAKSLGRLQLQAALPELTAALADPAWWVRYNAAGAIAALGVDGMRALRLAMDTAPDNFARDISRQLLQENGVLRALENSAGESDLARAAIP